MRRVLIGLLFAVVLVSCAEKPNTPDPNTPNPGSLWDEAVWDVTVWQ